eukprot:30142-Amphidinium_carterae.1
MEGRSRGEIGHFDEQPVSRTTCHLPLAVRQLRRTWSMMKSWLLSSERANTFLERVNLSRRQQYILKRTATVHGMHFDFISAISISLLKQRLDAEKGQIEHERISHWKQQMQQLSHACKYVRGEFVEHTNAILDETGQVRVGYTEKAQALEDYWTKVAIPPAETSLASISAFVKSRLAERPCGENFSITKFTASSILKACRATKKTSAP